MKPDIRFTRLVVIVNGAVPIALLAWDAAHDQLGVNGVNYALRTTGMLALVFLVLATLVTPLRTLLGWAWLVAPRRALGLYAFFYASIHFSIFFAFDRAASVASTVHEILTRTYLQIGTVTLVLMAPLAVTSTDTMVSRLGGRRWKLLHRAVYLVAVGGVLHFYLLVKADVRIPIAFAAVVALSFGSRPIGAMIERRRRQNASLASAATPRAKRRFWSGELRVASVRDETPDVRTFRLVAVDGGALPFDYQPGQYANLVLNIDGAKVPRSYTIASSPSREGHCEITVKREPRGKASRHLHESLREGSVLRVSAPAGRFTFTGSESESVVLLAGGVGITPMMSIARYLADRGWGGRIFLVYAARTEQDIVFKDELASLVEKCPSLRVVVTLTRAGAAWTGQRGRISRELLAKLEGELARSLFYICGPDEMMAATTAILSDLGVPADRVRTEAFVSPTGAAAEASESGPAIDGTFRVRFDVSRKEGEAGSDKTLLEASEDAGVPIAFECRSGICGQCKVRIVEGDVRMDVDAALSKDDRAKRLVLACQARPVRDVVVDA